MFGQALHLAGDEARSHAQYAHALELRRAALLYKQEFPEEEGTVHYWQFGEHIRRWKRGDD